MSVQLQHAERAAPLRIALIGAGSTVFARNLLGDILSYPELANSEIRLHDIDEHRLKLSELMARRVAESLGVDPRITSTLDRRAALAGADYVLSMIQVQGYRPGTTLDFEIPKRFGLEQTIGDTLGIGGISRALRTIPVLLDVVRDMEELCPHALHLNYVNPMAMITWALNKASPIQTVGLCHSVQGTAHELAADLNVPVSELRYHVAGINHMAFFLKLERNGEDLYPLLAKVLADGRMPAWNRVRYDAMRRFGYFPTESSEHFAEYVPWYIKRHRPELLEEYNIPLDEYPGRCQLYEVAWDFIERELREPGSQQVEALAQAIDDARIQVMPGSRNYVIDSFSKINQFERSIEYGATIIHAIETNTPQVIYGNVPNDHLIDNLPEGCCVEVPCLVDGSGVRPTRVGQLPPQLAALMRTNVNVQELTVEAVLTGKREHVYHAALLDPHTAAELDPDSICQMVDQLLEAHRAYLPATFFA